jgi:hypothetical protein
MDGCAQVTFCIREHVPREADDFLCAETGFDREQQDDLVPLRVARLSKEGLQVNRLAAAEGLGLFGEARWGARNDDRTRCRR